jgi:hypothetical protein|tara:strand:- start:1046 stop:1189 length:144 start_codon:yes stop_codon:yes gene_type:complete
LKKRLHNTTVHFDYYLTLLRGVSEKKKRRRRRRRRVEKRNKSFLYSY